MNIILYPGEIRSKYDNDHHFISAARLSELYGVRKDDNVVVAKGERELMQRGFSKQRIENKGWIELYPLYNGNYYNVHEHPSLLNTTE